MALFRLKKKKNQGGRRGRYTTWMWGDGGYFQSVDINHDLRRGGSASSV